MKLFSWIRLRAKMFWCYSGFGGCLIEFCHDCGVRQPVVWWADNSLWAKVTDEKVYDSLGNMAGVLCPTCFDHRATAKGLFLRWTPRVDGEPALPPEPVKL
jgi:hypothetical protein